MQKILYVIDTLEPGGTERSLLETVRCLDHARFLPHVCHVYPGESLKSEFEELGVPVTGLNVDKKYGFTVAKRRLGNLINCENPGLIHSSLFRANQIARACARKYRIPILGTFVSESYGPNRKALESAIGKVKLRAIQFMDQRSARHVDHFHSVSSYIRDANCKALCVPSSKVTVIPRGRNTADFAKRESSDWHEPAKLITVGRLVTPKALHVAISAIGILRDAGTNVHLTIAGDGPLRHELETFTASLELSDCVTFAGLRDDIPDMLAESDIFLLSSVYEGMPGAVIEAMMAGLPVVVSDIPMNLEVVTPNQNGLVFQTNNSLDLSRQIQRLVDDQDLASKLGTAAAIEARSQFDIEAVVGQLEDLYCSLIKSYNQSGAQLELV